MTQILAGHARGAHEFSHVQYHTNKDVSGTFDSFSDPEADKSVCALNFVGMFSTEPVRCSMRLQRLKNPRRS